MGQKVNPIVFRLPVRRNWASDWYASKTKYPEWVKEDFDIRDFLQKKLRTASVQNILLERVGTRLHVIILSGRPGVIIGRNGQGLNKLKSDFCKFLKKDKDIVLDVKEIENPDMSAKLIADSIAFQLERRVAFRRAMKKASQLAVSVGAKGIRIQCSGRLGGAEIARTESLLIGNVPLHTLNADVDYGFVEANTMYGTIGVKAWVCHPRKGEIVK